MPTREAKFHSRISISAQTLIIDGKSLKSSAKVNKLYPSVPGYMRFILLE